MDDLEIGKFVFLLQSDQLGVWNSDNRGETALLCDVRDYFLTQVYWLRHIQLLRPLTPLLLLAQKVRTICICVDCHTQSHKILARVGSAECSVSIVVVLQTSSAIRRLILPTLQPINMRLVMGSHGVPTRSTSDILRSHCASCKQQAKPSKKMPPRQTTNAGTGDCQAIGG